MHSSTQLKGLLGPGLLYFIEKRRAIIITQPKQSRVHYSLKIIIKRTTYQQEVKQNHYARYKYSNQAK